MIRPDWNQYFVDMLPLIARRSTCRRRQVAAIITVNNRIMATGYNGAPSKVYDCLDRGCLRDAEGAASGTRLEICRAVHAEQNAILHLPLGMGQLSAPEPGIGYPPGFRNIVLYTSTFPCSHCAKMLLVIGVTKVIYVDDYSDLLAKDLLAERFVETIQMSYSPEIQMLIECQKATNWIEYITLPDAELTPVANTQIVKITTREGIVAYIPWGMIILSPNHGEIMIPLWFARSRNLTT
jgi:dCMP deaminase